MTRSDILLAIIVAGEGHALQPVHLQKVAFLVAQEFPKEIPTDYYEFDDYRFGPFSAAIYADAEALEYWGQIQIHQSDQPRKRKYSGADDLTLETVDLPANMLRFIGETVSWARVQSFQQLVRSIYYMYPEYMTNSIFDFSEDEAFLESFRRGVNDLKEGRTYPARESLAELRRELESEQNADQLVG